MHFQSRDFNLIRQGFYAAATTASIGINDSRKQALIAVCDADPSFGADCIYGKITAFWNHLQRRSLI